MVYSILIFGGIFVTMLVKARPFIRIAKPGQELANVKLNIWQKMMVQRVSLYALGIVLVLGILAGWLNSILEWTALALAFAILLLPMRYTFTTQGVAVGDTIFRPWNDFNGVEARGGQIRLKNPSRLSGLTLFVTPAEREKVLTFITRRVKSKSQSKGEMK